jgi:adenosine deaminase
MPFPVCVARLCGASLRLFRITPKIVRIALPLAATLLVPVAPAGATNSEEKAAIFFDQVAAHPERLRVFLRAMPKGGDLHNHLWGAVYAEDLMRWAADDGLCVKPESLILTAPPCIPPETSAVRGLIDRDAGLYAKMIDSLSTRYHDQRTGADGVSGHDRFFSSFARFAEIGVRATGRMIAAARSIAARDRLSYVELMQGQRQGGALGNAALAKPWTDQDLASNLKQIEAGVAALVAQARAEMDQAEAEAARLGQCDTATPATACAIVVRYLATADRSQPPQMVFGQMVLGFALVESDPRFVGLTILAPEDHPVAIRDYRLHMRMFAFLRSRYPKARLTLHAGELAQGLVPPADLDFHIRDAIATAGAERIGHGVSIAHEANAAELLAQMACEKIAVEVNLTSNDVILGIKGERHPLALYRAAGVPLLLSTDDQGIARSEMTNEYLRAATVQGLRYRDLKQIARNSLEYAFIPGASLWSDGRFVSQCKSLTNECHSFLSSSEKARLQMKLEEEFTTFEKKIVTERF